MIMNEHELISIIMPIYNAGEYLNESISSIMNQTYKYFELICVDDCSTDIETLRYLELYSQDDNRLFVIYLAENTGAANARNIGFQYAKGKYTIFLDADDIFDKFFLEKMYNALKKSEAEVCLCGFNIFVKTIGDGYHETRRRYIPSKKDISDRESEDWLLKIPLSAWNKLYRTEYLRKYNIQFKNFPSSNDLYFSCKSLFCTYRVCVLETDQYIHYRMGTDKQISSRRNPLYFCQSINLLKAESNNINYLKQCDALLIYGVLWELDICYSQSIKKDAYKVVSEILKGSKFHYKNRILEKCKYNFTHLSFEDGWYMNYNNFFWQINLLSDEILKIIAKYKKISLWGNGARGKAFQKFCVKNNVILYGITDKKLLGKDNGRLSKEGILFKSENDVKQNSDLIIASNHMIFEALKEEHVKSKLINLEEFCPM